MSRSGDIAVGLNAVIMAVTEDQPRVLTVDSTAEGAAETERPALPYGPLDAEADRTLELGLRDWVRQQTGLDLGYVEQLYTFADRDRDPSRRRGGPRLLSVAYLALVREVEKVAGEGSRWRDVYAFFPWEDWRDGRPEVIERIREAVPEWEEAGSSAEERERRAERAELAFGLGGAGWDGYQVLERYELLYEIGLVREAWTDADREAEIGSRELLGEPMALDHRRILATALSRVRGKIKYRPVVFELMPPQFTLFQLQKVVESLAGVELHKQNFRRLVEKGGLVEGTGRIDPQTGGRPAELFRFRREVLRERLAPGFGVPSPRPPRA
ncbi:MAG: hypothetical protein R3244_11165 [Thermoanaerobaculia bacterium]|nr:hypothetical protein [Thermoanaerobaculia bacterium]